MRGKKQAQQLARQFFRLSLVDGRLSPEHVAAVLAYIEKNPPKAPLAVLGAYRRLIAAEVARGQALVEHAGPVDAALLASLGQTLSKRYGRPIVVTTKSNPALLAGLRVRIGDDVLETSVAGQLASLAV